MKNFDERLMVVFRKCVAKDGFPPTQQMLAKRLKASLTTVNNHIASLVAQGKLKRVRGGVAVLS